VFFLLVLLALENLCSVVITFQFVLSLKSIEFRREVKAGSCKLELPVTKLINKKISKIAV
jgi:hypothetical protein